MTYTYTTPLKSLLQTRAGRGPHEAIRWTYGEGAVNVRSMCGVPLSHIRILWIISLFHLCLLSSRSFGSEWSHLCCWLKINKDSLNIFSGHTEENIVIKLPYNWGITAIAFGTHLSEVRKNYISPSYSWYGSDTVVPRISHVPVTEGMAVIPWLYGNITTLIP